MLNRSGIGYGLFFSSRQLIKKSRMIMGVGGQLKSFLIEEVNETKCNYFVVKRAVRYHSDRYHLL